MDVIRVPLEFTSIIRRGERHEPLANVTNNKNLLVAIQPCLLEFGQFKVCKGTAESNLLRWRN